MIWTGDHERRLYAKLAENYNKLARPVRNESEAVVVLLGMDYQQILDIVSLKWEYKRLLIYILGRKTSNNEFKCLVTDVMDRSLLDMGSIRVWKYQRSSFANQ